MLQSLYCLISAKSRQSFHHFFLPQVHALMENRRKCRLTSQIGYKTTLSPQVVAIPGLLLWKEFSVSSAASWRLNAVSSDYIKQGSVWVINPQWPDRWEVCVPVLVLCVGRGGASSSGLWNKGFPFSLSLPLSLSLALFFYGSGECWRTSAVTVKIEQKTAEQKYKPLWP